MNRKAKGTRNEYKSRRLLEAAGYRVTRAAASLGQFDLIGVGATDIVLCQVKSNTWPGAIEIDAIKNFPAPSNCKKVIHRWDDYKALPMVKEVL